MKNKKGSLSLSINAIVVLILAITMLGLGLGFMRNMFGGVTKQFTEVTDQIQRDMVERLKESGEKVVLNTYDVKMKQSSKQTIYLAIQNEIEAPGTPGTFTITKSAPEKIQTTADCVDVGDISLIPSNSIRGGEAKVIPIIIQTGARDKETCEVHLEVTDSSGQPYGRVDFLITVG
jgi:hypothetical protein